MPQRYLFREVEAGTRRVGRKECSTTTNGACLRDGGKTTKNQTRLVSALASMPQSYVPLVTSPPIIYLKHSSSALTKNLQKAV